MCNFINENKNLFDKLDNIINDLPKADQSSVVYVLQQAQSLFGYLPKEVQLHIADKLNMAPVEVYGIVSFYDSFTVNPTV